jgi:hypothetical protein
MNGALNEYMTALRALPEKPNADLIKLAITPSETKLEQGIEKYLRWIGDFNTKMKLLRDEVESLMND